MPQVIVGLSPRVTSLQSPKTHTHTYLLVLLQCHTGLGPILGLNEEQLIPLDVFKNALGQGVQRRD